MPKTGRATIKFCDNFEALMKTFNTAPCFEESARLVLRLGNEILNINNNRRILDTGSSHII